MAGRKPLPTNLKIVKGTAQNCRLNKDEPKPASDNIRAPATLSKAAKRHWTKVLAQLKDAEIVTNLDVHALGMYCEAYARWADAQAKIEQFGSVVKDRHGFPTISPYMKIADKAFDQMRVMLAEFGMTPSSRAKVSKVSKPKSTTNPWHRL